MMTIAGIIMITIIAGLLIAVLAVVRYKRHLDKVVSGEERDLHTKAIEPGTVIRTALVCILGIWLLVSLANIALLKSEIQNMRQLMDDQYDWIDLQMQEMNSKLDAQGAVAEEYWFSFKNIDPENRTVEMELHGRLKEYSENTSVSLRFGNTVTELQNNSGDFSGNILVELFTPYESFPVLTSETEGVIRTQELDQCPDGYLAEFLLPTLVSVGSDSSMKYDRKGNLVLSGNMTVFADGPKIDELPTLQSASIAFELDGKIVKEIPLQFVDGVADAVNISGSFPVEKNQPFYICLKYVNSVGWTVTQRDVYYDWEEGRKEFMGRNLSVTDENGVLLFQVRENLD